MKDPSLAASGGLAGDDSASASASTSIKSAGNSREEQQRYGELYFQKPLCVGDKWYLVNSDWYSRWASYVGIQLNDNDRGAGNGGANVASPSPGKINNKTLLESANHTHLRTDITEEVDYYTIPEELWNYLVKIYSVTSQEDVIERLVINDGVEDEESLKIELRRMVVSYSCSKDKTVKTEEMSRQTTLEQVVEHMRTVYHLPASRQVRMFFKSVDNKMIQPVDISNKVTLNSSGYSLQDVIFLDVQNEDDTWPTQIPEKSAGLRHDAALPNSTAVPHPPPAPPLQTSQHPSSLSHTSHQPTTRQASASFSNRHHDYRPGLCGLSNLGNTCFMNSAIQCMSNVPLLTEYFRTGDYKKEINTVNPLGRKGEIAEAYADLVNEMWSGNNNYTMPRNFKLHLSRFAPQFTGFQQQDSHELLAFLLDGLHEDLNRIMKKPYVEMGSHVGKTDEQFAEESWQDHKKRNDSIIVDIFHGLLKSTLNCLVCNEISIKFDPFCYLSVPLPSKKERLVEVFFVPLDTTHSIVKYKLSVFKNGTIQDLCASLETHLPTVPKSRMCVCDVYTCKFFKIYEPNEAVSSIRERDDIYIYELGANLTSNDYLKVKVHLKEKSSYLYNSSFFGLPLFITVPKANLTYGILYKHILQSLKRFLKDTTSEEINSKMNNSLNVNDEENEEPSSVNNSGISNRNDDDEEWDAEPDSYARGSTSQRGNAKSKEQAHQQPIASNKLFNLIICKNDNIDYEGQHQSALSDDTPFDWQAVNSKEASSSSYHNHSASSSNQVISIIADFGQNFQKKFYNKKPIEEITEHSSCNSQLVKKKDVISLSDCFNLYTKTEELSEQDYWYCSKCKSHQASTKKFDLWSLPQVLVVHLKRFSYSRLYRDKIDTLVDFPLTDLDMSSYLINKNVKSSTKYNLIAVSNHYGSLGGGHYTAYGQNRYDGKWYYFDDSSVSSSDENSVCTNAAYLLIYLRQDLHNVYNNPNRTNNSQTERMDH